MEMSRDKAMINVLLRIAKFCGFCPLEKPSIFSVFYQLATLCLTFSVSLISVIRNGNNVYSRITPMHVFVDLLTAISITIQGTTIQLISLMYSTIWRKFIQQLQLNKKKHPNDWIIYMELFLIHLLFIVRIIWNGYVWITVAEWNLYKFYIHRTFHEYYATIAVTLMVHINRMIKNHLHAINVTLSKFPFTFYFEKMKFERQIQLREIESTYRKLMLLIDDFKCIFGYQILFIMGNAIVVMLESLRNALKHGDFSDMNKKMLVLIWSVISTIFVLVNIPLDIDNK